MFGEEKISLAKEIKLDNKSRIKIPSSTRVVAEESIGMLYSNSKDRLLLYNGQEYERILSTALSSLEEKKQNGIYDAKFLRLLQRKLFGEFCFNPENTDTNLRVLLPRRAVETLELETLVYVVGVDTHLEIFKNEQSYKMSLQKRN